jgi:hypothetical protein
MSSPLPSVMAEAVGEIGVRGGFHREASLPILKGSDSVATATGE